MTQPTADLAHLRAQVDQLVRAGDTRQLKAIRDKLKSGLDKRDLGVRTSKYGAHPVRWVEERLRQTVWSKQREILHAVRDNRRTAVRSGHGVGKSWTAALVACWWLDTHEPGEAFVVSTAPTFSQVRAILWRYIRKHHRAGDLAGRVNQTEWLIDDELVGYGRKPADTDEDGFQGIHARYVLVILDEACGIPGQLWTAADALATGPDCRILAIGNPDNPASHFRKVCTPGSGWTQLTISAFDSPNLTGETIPEGMAAALVSREWVEEKARDWGEENPIYRAKVLGEFTQDAANQVVRASDVAACRLPDEKRATADELLPVELGVDVGGGGDETVIRERRGRRAGREWRAHTDRPEKIAPLVLAAVKETGATAVKIDSIGIGFGVIGELRNAANRGEHTAQIVGVNVSTAASRPDKYLNLRAEMWWELGRGLSERGGWDLCGMDNGDTAVAQMLEPRWDVDPSGRIRVEKKEEIKKRLGRSPDNADALLLAFYNSGITRVRWL
ncbi:hypothetical protein [Streptomyces niveus]|uniref:hypothetical protein n=1 Tax=Streptomyces niveus TaxID=193462 RepID=UPI0034301E0C